MKLTIIQTGDVPQPLRDRFGPYHAMFERMFDAVSADFTYQTVLAYEDELPDPEGLEGIVLTGSAAGVYDALEWLEPLRVFIRSAYAAEVPMVGICFGHQIMADALGGVVRKSEKGWGIGRHRYAVQSRPSFMSDAPDVLAIACSHQDQVIVPPPEAEVVLASAFAPHAGLVYKSGKALSFQPHPEFDDDYALALAELRRGSAPEAVVEQAALSLSSRSDSGLVAQYIARFFKDTDRD